jgi:hypothetical protein
MVARVAPPTTTIGYVVAVLHTMAPKNYLARNQSNADESCKCNFSTTKQDLNKVKVSRGAPYYGDIKIQLSVQVTGELWRNRENSYFLA